MWSALLVALAALIGTGLVLWLPLPESGRVSSADGAVRVSGVWSPSAPPPTITRFALSAFSAIMQKAYAVSALPMSAPTPFKLTFAVPADLVGEAPVLYRYRPDLDAWQAYPAAASADGWTLSTSVGGQPASVWGVGAAVSFTRPARARDVLSGLLAAPPPDAVGYEAYDAAVDAKGDAVLLSDPLDAGGCGGAFQLGRSATVTSRDLPLPFGISYRVIVRWRLGDGCAPGEAVASAHPSP